MKSRDLALIAILLAIGAVIYLFTPNIGMITPDTVVTFAALAILLVRPKLLEGLGIGIIAGLLGMFFSKSSIAWFNVPAHAIGALVTAGVTLVVGELMTGPIAWKPAVGALAYGVVSGGLFITAMLVAQIFPFQVYLAAGWPQVLLSTLSSIIICMILYLPAKALYERAG
jgi:hypothetical protein